MQPRTPASICALAVFRKAGVPKADKHGLSTDHPWNLIFLDVAVCRR